MKFLPHIDTLYRKYEIAISYSPYFQNFGSMNFFITGQILGMKYIIYMIVNQNTKQQTTNKLSL
jgi:hypothetical protein